MNEELLAYLRENHDGIDVNTLARTMAEFLAAPHRDQSERRTFVNRCSTVVPGRNGRRTRHIPMVFMNLG